ncbi:MAG: MBL fold metallo-hydrolase [Candidatus Heimdallarchaeota archaeon]
MDLVELADSVIVCQDRSYYQVNMVCINLTSELVFVDTCTKPPLAAKFRKTMEARFGEKKATLVITHANGDHFQAIDAFDDLPVVVSVPFLKRVKQYNIPRKRMKLLQEAQTFSKEITFGQENHKLIFHWVGGHTADSIYGLLPSEKIVIAGDNLISNMPQYFPFADTDLAKWVNCLKNWENLDVDRFICGHGGIVGKNHVAKVRRFFEALRAFLVSSKKENLSMEEVLTHPDLPSYFEADPEGWIENGLRQTYDSMQ